MKTESQIKEMIKILEERQNFFEEQWVPNADVNNLPSPIEDAASKTMALRWVLNKVEDMFEYPLTHKSLNQEVNIIKILDEIVK